ncbi:MAG TPA: redoxin family protein [Armatimonadota bacterium]|jgi:thiol-disulfide isomerase/thioredoxin
MRSRSLITRAALGVLALALLLPLGFSLWTNASAAARVPELRGGKEDWLNTTGPLSMASLLDGKHVVLVDFWEYTCVNCLRTLPYLQAWQKRYGPEGLVIIGIHTPEFQFAREKANVKDAVKRLGITWPVLVDSNYENWNAYGNNVWPRKYLVDATGAVVYDHSGEGGYAEIEKRIQLALRQINPGRVFPLPVAPVRDTDRPGAVCYPMTPEVYAGYERGMLANGAGPDARDAALTYRAPGAYPDGVVGLIGQWSWGPESVRHARTTKDLSDSVNLRYHALEVNAVLKPEDGKPLRVYVTQDGKPLSRMDWGEDILTDDSGRPYLLVDTPRMYHVVKNHAFGSFTLTLASDSPAFGLYSYTFGSCQVPGKGLGRMGIGG